MRATPVTSSLLAVLRTSAGAIVSMRELIDAVYRNHRDGGGIAADGNVRHAIMRLRRRGYSIVNHHGRGYQLVVA